jgi:YD repeat-containing protein
VSFWRFVRSRRPFLKVSLALTVETLKITLSILAFITTLGSYGSAHAGYCKQWVQIDTSCSIGCSIANGAFCDEYQCRSSSLPQPPEGEAIVYSKWPGWAPAPVINEESCTSLCTEYTFEAQCPPGGSPNKITMFEASSASITVGEEVTFNWEASGCVQNVTLSVGNRAYNFSGLGTKTQQWAGTDVSKNILAPVKVEAVLSISGECGGTDTLTREITINPAPCKSCPCPDKFPFFSSVSLLTGALQQSEQLFASKGGGFAPTVTLFYNSLSPYVSTLGAKWTHSYDIGLTVNKDSSVTIREADAFSLFVLQNGAYVSSTDNKSSLVKTAENIYVLVYLDGSSKRFDATGHIFNQADLNGNDLSFAYSNGNLISVTDTAARTVTYTYDANNRLASIADPAGKIYSFSYSGDFLTAVTWPDGGSWQYSYDTNGLMLTKTDPVGKVTTYTYDADHRVVEGTKPSGSSKGMDYPTVSGTVKSSTITDDNGGVWTYKYDSHHGYMTEMIDPLGNSTTYAYDANQNRILETAPNGSYTSYTYDSAGNRSSVTDALGNLTTYTYNILGQVTSTTDPLGRTTTSSYDSKGLLSQTIDVLGRKTSYTYDAKGNLTSTSNALQQISSFTYDTANNQVAATDPTGVTTTSTYDGMGNVLTQTDTLGSVTSYEYDGRYRLSKITDQLGNVTSYTYDLKGHKTSETDANGNVTGYEYDDEGNLTKTIDAAGDATTYTYGTAGCSNCGGGANKLISLADAKGQTTSYQYDLLGRLKSELDPLSKPPMPTIRSATSQQRMMPIARPLFTNMMQ